MKLTKASSYALQAVAYLTQQKDLTDPVASRKIAEVRKIPERFLLKVLKPLVEKGLLTSVKGPGGGYKLAKPAAQISLADIIEAIDEDGLRGFNAGNKTGSPAINSRLEAICRQSAESVRAHLDGISVTDLLGKQADAKPRKR
ncbi:MAG: RrF2 family transcriptional regulator [Gemmataceae bacterium]